MNQRFREVSSALVGVGVCTLVLLVIYNSVVARQTIEAVQQTQETGSPTLIAIQDVIDQIRSCTDPAGDCYKRGQRATADAIGSINEVSTYAAACADQPGVQSVGEIQACIIQKLATERKGQQP